MRFLLLLFILILPSTANQQKAHSRGQSFGKSTLKDVKNIAKSFSLQSVPGFQTDRPPEASLDSGALGEKSLLESQTNPVSKNLIKNAKERPNFKVDPDTDPLFRYAKDAVRNPEQALQETITEARDSKESPSEDIHTCEESGEEYIQKCSKRLVIELEVTPEKGHTAPKWCIGHWRNKTLGIKYNCSGCRSGEYIIDQPRSVVIVREEWVDDCKALEDLTEQGVCRYVSKTLNPLNETRTIQNEPITRDHFEEHLDYACLKVASKSCKGYREKGCYQIASKCKEWIKGKCVVWKQTYRCPSGKKSLQRHKNTNPRSLFCLTGNCADTSYKANTEMLSVMSQLSVLREAQNDLKNVACIFKGEDLRCTRNCVDFRDCCGNGRGWGVSMGLSSCSKLEKELAILRQKDRCVLIGTYCAEKLGGICLRKKTTFCCYGTKIARLIQEAAHTQLGISWGTAENPHCDALSQEHLSRVDFSKIDFTKVFEDITSQMTLKNQTQTLAQVSAERIKENMNNLVK